MRDDQNWFCFGAHRIRSDYEKVTIPQEVFFDGILDYDDDNLLTFIDEEGRYGIAQDLDGLRGVEVREFKQPVSISRPDNGNTRVLHLVKDELQREKTGLTYDSPAIFAATERMIEPEDHSLYLLSPQQLRESIHNPELWKRSIDVERIENSLSDANLPELHPQEKQIIKKSVPGSNDGQSYQSHPEITVLGSAQDGGVPQVDCSCPNCERARNIDDEIRYVSSLEITAKEGRKYRYIIDPSPDLRFQTSTERVDGIFLTHAHMGQITGLLQFGNEVSDALRLPIYCSADIKEYLFSSAGPFSALADENQIQINEIFSGETIEICGGHITPYRTPHEYSPTETFCYFIEGKGQSLVYISDIDYWTDDVTELVHKANIAIVDGCFWDNNEIARQESVPHPPISNTIDRFRDADTDIYFTNLNHTNPVINPESEEANQLKYSSFDLAEFGLEFDLLEPAAHTQ